VTIASPALLTGVIAPIQDVPFLGKERSSATLASAGSIWISSPEMVKRNFAKVNLMVPETFDF
jgi:hypothetical protein